jgi:glutaredoxin
MAASQIDSIRESSPYLLLHATNPVDWYPWGEEAIAKARGEDTPSFLSIGYSTCSWCHVAGREDFSDEPVARLVNGSFVKTNADRRATRPSRKFLAQRGITFEVRDITKDERSLDELQELGLMTTPVTVIDGEPVVGLDRKRLETLLAE